MPKKKTDVPVSIETEQPVLEPGPPAEEGSAEQIASEQAVVEAPEASAEAPAADLCAPPGGEEAPVDTLAPGEESGYGDILEELNKGTGTAEGEADADPLTLPPMGGASEEKNGYSDDDLLLLGADAGSADEEPAEQAPVQPQRPVNSPQDRVLTINARDEVQTAADREAMIWHEIQSSYRSRRMLTGTLDGIERTESGLTLAVVDYKGFRVAIPLKEMMLVTGRMPSGDEYVELMEHLNRILNARLGSEIDFVVKGCDNATRSVVASRREAMLKKRQTFYMDTDELGRHLIYEGRIVQARIVAVAEKVVRIEAFGVECSIRARGLSWEWIGNAHDHFSVGDRVLVRILTIDRPDVENITITADMRSVSNTTKHDNLKKCIPQARYAGRVTDVRNGLVYIRLNNGVNAIAHSCYDRRMPGKQDDVSFAVTHLDEDRGIAVGIITRIIKQNL